MKKPGKIIKIFIALIVIIMGSILVDSWFLEPNRIKNVCDMIYTGTSASDVYTKAKEFNLRLIESHSDKINNKIIKVHGSSLGRYLCEVQHDGNQVIKSEFKKAKIR